MNIAAAKAYTRARRALTAEQGSAVDAALATLPETFGRPHAHAGASIRVRAPGLYELRAGLTLRILFARDGDTLLLAYVGTHAQVTAWVKNNR